MKNKGFFELLSFYSLCCVLSINSVLKGEVIIASPPPGNRWNSANDTVTVLRQTQNSILEIKHGLRNLDTELKVLDEKEKTQEDNLEKLREEVFRTFDHQKELSHTNQQHAESRLNAMDQTLKSIVGDVKQLRLQANETTTLLLHHKQKIVDFEKVLDAQAQHMKQLENALQSILDLLQAKQATEKSLLEREVSVSKGKGYKVQSGDTLEKISRKFNVSLQTLRDSNQMTNDRIMVGQTIIVP